MQSYQNGLSHIKQKPHKPNMGKFRNETLEPEIILTKKNPTSP